MEIKREYYLDKLIKRQNSCITTRGIKRNNAKTTTLTLSGKFKDDPQYKNNFLQNVG